MDLLNIESVTATRIEYRVRKAIGEECPNITFTTEISDTPASFPNVYIHLTSSSEVGKDLQGTSLNAMSFSVQIVIKTNTDKSECLKVRNACIDAVKKDGFRVVINEPQKINNIHQCTLHFYGVRGCGDVLK